MRYLRTNTATIVTVGPFFDKTDGVSLENALTITNESITFVVDLNNGSAPTVVLDAIAGATSGTSNDLNYISGCDAGLMQLELAAANVNYLGRAFLTITDAANHVPVFHEFTILPAVVYDALVAGTDNLVTLLSSGTGTGQVTLSSGLVALTATEHTNIADALLKRDFSAVTGEAARSALNALRFLRNKWSISASTLTVTKENDSTAAWTAELTSSSSADPVIGSDPA